MKRKKSVEDYLKTIYVLSKEKEVHGADVAGKRIAEETYERHKMFRNLLTGLGVDEETAAEDACQMEHAISRESFEAFLLKGHDRYAGRLLR